MKGEEEGRVLSAANLASQIACLCSLVGEALGADPDNTVAAEAVEGVARRSGSEASDNLDES